MRLYSASKLPPVQATPIVRFVVDAKGGVTDRDPDLACEPGQWRVATPDDHAAARLLPDYEV